MNDAYYHEGVAKSVFFFTSSEDTFEGILRQPSLHHRSPRDLQTHSPAQARLTAPLTSCRSGLRTFAAANHLVLSTDTPGALSAWHLPGPTPPRVASGGYLKLQASTAGRSVSSAAVSAFLLHSDRPRKVLTPYNSTSRVLVDLKKDVSQHLRRKRPSKTTKGHTPICLGFFVPVRRDGREGPYLITLAEEAPHCLPTP